MDNIVDAANDNTLVQMIFVLLILSMVAEKVTNFVKLHFPNTPLRNMLNPSLKITSDTTVEEYESFEKKRTEREIQMLAIIIGIGTAIVTRATIFQINRSDFILGWIGLELSYMGTIQFWQDILGCIITGIFLSLGSKFFHDLLGLVYQIKEAKGKVAEGPSVKAQIRDLAGIPLEVPSNVSVVQNAILQQVSSIPGYVRYEVSPSESRVDVYLSKGTPITEELTRFTKLSLPGGQSKAMEFNYINLEV